MVPTSPKGLDYRRRIDLGDKRNSDGSGSRGERSARSIFQSTFSGIILSTLGLGSVSKRLLQPLPGEIG